MSPEAPKRIEEWLRRYAEKRREQGGGFELHPATRSMLQAEVKRQFGRQRKGAFAWFMASPLRLLAGGAVAASVVIAGWLAWPDASRTPTGEPVQFAKAFDEVERADPPHVEQTREEESLVRLISERERRASTELEEAPMLRRQVAAPPPSPVRANSTTSLAAGGVVVPELAYRVARTADAEVTKLGQLSTVDSLVRSEIAPAAIAPSQELQLTADNDNLQPRVRLDAARLYFSDQLAVTSTGTLSAGLELAAAQTPAANEPAARATGVKDDALAPSNGNRVAATPPPASVPLRAAQPAAAAAARLDAEQKTTESVLAGDRVGIEATRPALAVAQQRFYRLTTFSENEAQGQSAERDVAAKKLEAAESGPVLANFVVEQRAEVVRVIDSDNSVYEGRIQAQPEARVAESLEVQNIPRATPQQGQVFYFRAVGTNRTLQQRVVVNGRYLSQVEAFGTAGVQLGRAVQEQSTPMSRSRAIRTENVTAPEQVPQRRARFSQMTEPGTNVTVMIEGTVQVGTLPDQRFRAVTETR